MTDPIQGDFSQFIKLHRDEWSEEFKSGTFYKTTDELFEHLDSIERRPDGSIPGWRPVWREKPETD